MVSFHACSWFFFACFPTSLILFNRHILLLHRVLVSPISHVKPQPVGDGVWGALLPPHQPPGRESTVCLLLLLYSPHKIAGSAIPLQTNRGSQLAFKVALLHMKIADLIAHFMSLLFCFVFLLNESQQSEAGRTCTPAWCLFYRSNCECHFFLSLFLWV